MISPLNAKLDRKWIEASQRIAELEQQRDELLAVSEQAFKALVWIIHECKQEPAMQNNKYVYVGQACISAKNNLEAAIAKVKPC